MHERPRFPIRELEKCDDQADETGDSDDIKKCGHLASKPIRTKQIFESC
jgi:hypothetical protein